MSKSESWIFQRINALQLSFLGQVYRSFSFYLSLALNIDFVLLVNSYNRGFLGHVVLNTFTKVVFGENS